MELTISLCQQFMFCISNEGCVQAQVCLLLHGQNVDKCALVLMGALSFDIDFWVSLRSLLWKSGSVKDHFILHLAGALT